jgi:NADPH:quinone reductase-like Zn-dependent oxidoreductase
VLVTAVGDAAAGARRPDARWVFFVVEANRAQLAELGRRFDAGQLRPVIGGEWPLAKGAEAFQAKQHGGLPGKVVLRVGDARHPAGP